MATKNQIQANRRNARKSTGPRSAAGKAKVSRNAVKHGLSSSAVVLPTEDESAYRLLCAALEAEWEPQTTTERFLVDQMAAAQWKLTRIDALETALLAGRAKPAARERSLEQFSRHQTRLRRAWHQAIKALMDLRKARQILAEKLTKQTQDRLYRCNGNRPPYQEEPPIQTRRILRRPSPDPRSFDNPAEPIIIRGGEPPTT